MCEYMVGTNNMHASSIRTPIGRIVYIDTTDTGRELRT